MWIKAQIVLSVSKERDTKRDLKYLTELFMIDSDSKQNLYVGQMWGDKPHTYPENEIVTFQVGGVYGQGKKIYLSLLPEEENIPS